MIWWSQSESQICRTNDLESACALLLPNGEADGEDHTSTRCNCILNFFLYLITDWPYEITDYMSSDELPRDHRTASQAMVVRPDEEEQRRSEHQNASDPQKYQPSQTEPTKTGAPPKEGSFEEGSNKTEPKKKPDPLISVRTYPSLNSQ